MIGKIRSRPVRAAKGIGKNQALAKFRVILLVFPVTAPVISLLVPCYDFKRKSFCSSAYEDVDAFGSFSQTEFPLFFPVIGNLAAETG